MSSAVFEACNTKFSWNKHVEGHCTGVSEASEIGLKPGIWPTKIIVKGKYVHKLFTMDEITDIEGIKVAGTTGFKYTSECGKFSIFITND